MSWLVWFFIGSIVGSWGMAFYVGSALRPSPPRMIGPALRREVDRP